MCLISGKPNLKAEHYNVSNMEAKPDECRPIKMLILRLDVDGFLRGILTLQVKIGRLAASACAFQRSQETE